MEADILLGTTIFDKHLLLISRKIPIHGGAPLDVVYP